MVDFSGILDTGQVEDLQIMKGKLRDGKELRNCKQGKLITKMKDVNGKFYDFSVSPNIRQILLYQSQELVKNDLSRFIYFFI